MIKSQLLFTASLLLLSFHGTISVSSHAANRKKRVVTGYVREAAIDLYEKTNRWNLNFAVKTIYLYYHSISSIGTPFTFKKKFGVAYQHCNFTSLYAPHSYAIITNQRHTKILKKWSIKANSIKQDGEVTLSCLGSSTVKDMIFFPPVYIVILLKNGSVYTLKFLEQSLKLSRKTTEEELLLHNNHLSSQKIRVVAWRTQLLLLRCDEKSSKKVNISIFQAKKGKLVLEKSTYLFVPDFDFYFCGSFLYRRLHLYNLGEVGYLFDYPFFEVESDQKNINHRYVISKDQNGFDLVLHKSVAKHQKYDRKSCCYYDTYEGERKFSTKFMAQSPLNCRSSELIGNFLIYKDKNKPYICVYDAQLGVTYHRVFKLGYDAILLGGFYVDHSTFILITGRDNGEDDFDYQQPEVLPFIHDRSPEGLGSCQIVLMEWRRGKTLFNFLSILEEEYDEKDNFVERFCSWIALQGLTRVEEIEVRLKKMALNHGSRKMKGKLEKKNYFDLTNKQFVAITQASERLNQVDNLQAKVVHYQVSQEPMYRFLYTGSHIVGATTGGYFQCFPVS